MNICQAFLRSRTASVATVFALVLPILLGFAALVAEFGSVLVTEARNQRVADLASYAGALAYNSVSTGKDAAALAAAQRIATLNGLSSSAISVGTALSIKTAGATSVRATVQTPYTLLIARVLRSNTSVPVSTEAYTEVSGGASSCILALSGGGSGVTLSGGTSITAPTCAVNSNNKVYVPNGPTITASAVSYGTTLFDPGNGITADTKVQATTTDPLAGNAGVSTLASRVTGTVAAITRPTIPTLGSVSNAGAVILKRTDNGGVLNPAIASGTSMNLANGCTATLRAQYGNDWTINCPAGGTYNFGEINNSNYGTWTLFPNSTAGTTYNISGAVNVGSTVSWGPGTYKFGNNVQLAGTNTFSAGTYSFTSAVSIGGTATFGSGTYNFAQGLNTTGGSNVTFGSGTFYMGQGTVNCYSYKFSLCHLGTSLTFYGPSTFVFTHGLSVPAGYTLRMGYDASNAKLTGNSYKFGSSTASSSADAIYTGGGGTTLMADATDSGKVFELFGNFNAGGGSSCTVIPAAAQHDINGNFRAGGAVKLGAGVYSVNGYVGFGVNGGGGGSCDGETVSIKGIDVNFVISGAATIPNSGNSCDGKVFCSVAGYSNVVLKAPTSGAYKDLLVIGPQSSTVTAGGFFGEGSNHGVLNGVMYFPYGPLNMNGGASVADQAGGCFQLIATQITIDGGATMASACIGGSGSQSAKLVR